MEITINTPAGFSFKRTVASHGWCELPPFEFDKDAWTLTRVIGLGRSNPVTVKVSQDDGVLKIGTRRKLGREAAAKVVEGVRHMLRLDDDMNDFYEAMARDKGFAWIAAAGAGRMLRSPTVFEDLVKTICTTNCSWALTDKMVKALVAELGRPSDDGRRDFPTPGAMADAPVEFYRDRVRAGYRAPYFKELAGRVASGELDVEGWLTSGLPTAELKREMKRVKGVGDYAAENMLKLLGRYDCLALDSWVRGKFARMRNGGRETPDARIERYYSRFGEWRGLALWCDMTRDWLEEETLMTWGRS